MANKRNWDRIRNQRATETVKNRDVYEDQQLERGQLTQKESMLSRNILNGFVSVLAFVIVWFFASLLEMFFSGSGGLESNGNPAAEWFHVNAHYVNVNDTTDKLTPDEYQNLLLNYDPSLPEIEEPEAPENPSKMREDYIGGFGWGYTASDGTVYSEDEYKALKKAYKAKLTQYEQEMTEYRQYCQRRTDPAETYKSQIEHYRSYFDTETYILPEEYDEKVKAYQSSVSSGKIGEDLLDVPDVIASPAVLYNPYEYDYPVSIDLADPGSEENSELEKVPVTYINKYDGTKISSYEYDSLLSQYEAGLEAYKAAYQAHREKYHPDDIDGTAKVLNLGFTTKKFFASIAVAAIVFSLLYHVLSKNLKAQNLLADTSDINQYHNDQHIALPEEVQRNYDWFPDVGAHSAVQVSSMISHMALTNKGLKTVQLAKRADKDIVDENGNVEYFKGEILMDENGEPITKTVPMIDEEFMEDLFEASGAPNVKEIRKRYDTTKIPYNPDGKNRDKLGKFDTVADLINNDWEFPVYEPQRPGGAYIVDTAPVNTMV